MFSMESFALMYGVWACFVAHMLFNHLCSWSEKVFTSSVWVENLPLGAGLF